MKKSLLALSAAAFALTGMAASPLQMTQSSRVSLDRSQALQTNIKGLNPQGVSSRVKKVPAKAAVPEDILENVEGTVQPMTTVGSGYYVYWFWVIEYEDQEVANEVVYGDNDEVYFYNLLPNAATNTYMKGVKKGDKVEVSFDQLMTWSETEIQGEDGETTIEAYGLKPAVFDYVEEVDPETGDDISWWYENTEIESITFSVAEDGSMVMDELAEGQLFGYKWSDDNSWSGYGAYALSLTPFNEVAVELPADYEAVPDFWTLTTKDLGWKVTWAQGAQEVYFQGLADAMPEAWVKGSLDMVDDTTAVIRIAQNQYLGNYASARIFTIAAKLIYDEETGDLIDGELMPADYEYELVWDFENMTITPKDPEVSLLYNAAKDRVYYLQILDDYKLAVQEDYAGTPANPYNVYFNDTLEYYGYSGFFFTVPCISTEGELLDADSLYYVVYVDGEEWEFDAEEYELDENLTEIPWNYLSGYYIYYLGGAQREVDFFIEGISTLGVQSVYKYDGEETRSEIVTIELDDPTSVIAVGDKKVASVKYYGIDGREVANPAAGIFVKRVTFEDGTVATFKKAVR